MSFENYALTKVFPVSTYVTQRKLHDGDNVVRVDPTLNFLLVQVI